MALYLGNDKITINLNDVMYLLNIYSSELIINGILLLSSDDYILRDINGLYLTAKEAE